MAQTPNLGFCKNQWCLKSLAGKRPDADYCSSECYDRRKRFAGAVARTCAALDCQNIFPLKDRSDANRKYCSDACAKRTYQKASVEWRTKRPGYMAEYNATRTAKNPGVWVEKSRAARAEALELLGGKCSVPICHVTNPHWLHIDFIPTTRGTPYRHSRGIAYLRKHLELFRLLCANHHYELTLTGKIEGSNITQLRLVPGTKKETIAA
jgi:hypothetical protein